MDTEVITQQKMKEAVAQAAEAMCTIVELLDVSTFSLSPILGAKLKLVCACVKEMERAAEVGDGYVFSIAGHMYNNALHSFSQELTVEVMLTIPIPKHSVHGWMS